MEEALRTLIFFFLLPLTLEDWETPRARAFLRRYCTDSPRRKRRPQLDGIKPILRHLSAPAIC